MTTAQKIIEKSTFISNPNVVEEMRNDALLTSSIEGKIEAYQDCFPTEYVNYKIAKLESQLQELKTKYGIE